MSRKVTNYQRIYKINNVLGQGKRRLYFSFVRPDYTPHEYLLSKIRKNVLDYLKTHTVSETSRKFEIARYTIFTWEKQSRDGYVKPVFEAWFKKIDPEKLWAIVTENPDLLLREMAEIFNSSIKSVGVVLKRIDFNESIMINIKG